MNIIDRANLYTGRIMYPTSERNNRLRFARGVMAISSLMLVTTVDMTDATVEACVYSFDGQGNDIIEVAQSLRFDTDGIGEMMSGECTPYIGNDR